MDVYGGGDGRRGVAEEAGDGKEIGCTVIEEGAAGVAEFVGVQYREAEGGTDAFHEWEIPSLRPIVGVPVVPQGGGDDIAGRLVAREVGGKGIGQRELSAAGLIFGLADIVAAGLIQFDRPADGNRLMEQVDVLPPEAEELFPAEAEFQEDRHRQALGVGGGGVKEPVAVVGGVGALRRGRASLRRGDAVMGGLINQSVVDR